MMLALRQACVAGFGKPRITSIWKQTLSQRCLSAASSANVDVKLDESSGVAVLTMTKKPANSLDKTMILDLHKAFDQLESNKKCRGVIFTSNIPNLFSVGLDLQELHQPSKERLGEFWGSLQDLWIRFYGSRLTSVAAINGHAPAGGCLLALCSDYRIMASGKYTIGLNEALLGFPAPFWLMDGFVNTIGFREAEEALKIGRLYSVEEALKVGLVDEVVTQDELSKAAQRAMDKYLSVPDIGRGITKNILRGPILQKLVARKQEDIDQVVTMLSVPKVQESLGMYIKALKERKK